MRSRALCLIAALACATVAAAQERPSQPELTAQQKAEMDAYMKAATPGEQHKYLVSMAGNYDVVIRTWDGPDAPPHQEKGTATRTPDLGGRVVVERVTASIMGTPFTGTGMSGFDNVSGKYWSTWIDTISTGLMVSEGTCDARHTCTFTGTWNEPVTKGPVKMRMITRWTNPSTEVFEMYGPGRDGKEMKLMEMTYTKK